MGKRRPRLKPDAQVDLLLRKRMAVAVLLAICADRYAQQEERPIEGPQAQALVKRLNGIIEDQIAQEAHIEHRSLGEFVAAIGEELIEIDRRRPDDPASKTLLDRFLTGAEQFNCVECGTKKSAICDGWNDADIFRDPKGGLCLRFLPLLVDTLAKVTVAEYGVLAKGCFKRPNLPGIQIETQPWEASRRATLPIDGEWRPPVSETEGCGTLKVVLPVFEDMGEAIKSLPYLVFHEVFVHWPQGCASPERPFVVDSGCNFTEGAVDAVACEVLLRVLDQDHCVLPANLRFLRGAFIHSARRYHEKRMEWERPEDRDTRDDPIQVIAEARFRGREGVYTFLNKVFRRNNREDCERFAARIILSLNTQLGETDRDEFYLLLHDIREYDPNGDRDHKVLDAFDGYLEKNDCKQLLTELSLVI